MEQRKRHRHLFEVLAMFMSSLVIGGIVIALAVESDGLRRQLAECRAVVEAQGCECRAYYAVPPQGQTEAAPDTINTSHGQAQTIYGYFSGTEYAEVADVIVAMSMLETGNYKSSFHLENSNYFSTKRKPDGVNCIEGGEKSCFSIHRSLRESCDYALKFVFRKKMYRTDRDGFLKDLVRNRYAEDPKYVDKVKAIAKQLNRRSA